MKLQPPETLKITSSNHYVVKIQISFLQLFRFGFFFFPTISSRLSSPWFIYHINLDHDLYTLTTNLKQSDFMQNVQISLWTWKVVKTYPIYS